MFCWCSTFLARSTKCFTYSIQNNHNIEKPQKQQSQSTQKSTMRNLPTVLSINIVKNNPKYKTQKQKQQGTNTLKKEIIQKSSRGFK